MEANSDEDYAIITAIMDDAGVCTSILLRRIQSASA